jgi:lycopene beta-cyclase
MGAEGAGVDVDVAVGGDGPAGSAIAAACATAGLGVVLVGEDRPWTATYGSWRDDVADLPDAAFASVVPSISVFGDRRHDLARPYGVLDNEALRAHLRRDVEHRRERVTGVQHFTWGSRLLAASGAIDARLVIDAAGWPPLVAAAVARHDPAWQTAYGVLVTDRPAGYDGPVLMDLRPVPGRERGSPTFAYVVPVGGGWLVEETVLAARPAVDPATLSSRLRDRLGPWPPGAVTEQVRIPMGASVVRATPTVIPFGASAGFVHPATGYSLASSLRAAPRVAAAVATSIGDGRAAEDLMADTWAAVWPDASRRTRRLHRLGLVALLGLDGPGTRAFFDTFFELPVERWSAYLRIDSPPGEVARTMRAVFAAAPGPVRRHLAAAVPHAIWRTVARR